MLLYVLRPVDDDDEDEEDTTTTTGSKRLAETYMYSPMISENEMEEAGCLLCEHFTKQVSKEVERWSRNPNRQGRPVPLSVTRDLIFKQFFGTPPKYRRNRCSLKMNSAFRFARTATRQQVTGLSRRQVDIVSSPDPLPATINLI